MTHAFCFFYSIGRRVRWGTSIALAPKKTVALQAKWGLFPDVVPVLSESGAGVTASLANQASPAVVLVPSVGQTDTGAEGAPSEVIEQSATEVILLPTLERMELPLALAAPTVVGATPPVEALPTQAEVATTVTSQA